MTNTISVIIPVYNGEKYLAEAITSVLNQTHPPQEIIVVDDGSTDNTAAVAQQFSQIRYEQQPNNGAATARNRGVELAQGELLAFLDADDLWSEDKLALQLAALAAESELEAVFGHVRQFRSPELEEAVKQQIKIPQEIMPGQHVGAMLIKKASFEQVGNFNTELEIGEFIDWQARATELKLKSLMLPEVVMQRRLHKASQGTYKKEHQKEYVRVLKAALDRRRKMGQKKQP